MTAIKLTQKVKNGGIFIPLEGFDNQLLEIEVNISSIRDVKTNTDAFAIADSFFSKIDKKKSIDLDKLNVYEQ